MSCNSCGKSFTVLRKERGCPDCGYSFCSGCLKSKVYVPKLSAEVKVCNKCSQKKNPRNEMREPPEIFIKRLESLENPPRPPIVVYEQDKYQRLKRGLSSEDQQMVDRLKQLREDRTQSSEDVESQIAHRLNKLKAVDEVPSLEQVQERLSNLKGEASKSKAPSLPLPETRSEQEQSEEIIRQYMEELKMKAAYEESFDSKISDMESRLQALSGAESSASRQIESDSEDEEEIVTKVINKIKEESELECKGIEKEPPSVPVASADTAELPWCEICNEDATRRCLGCRYLFCKTCFDEHKDDDEDCNRFEPYKKPNKLPI